MGFTENDNGREIEVRVGQTFEVSLPETRTAGFSWSVNSSGEPVCSIIAQSFENQNATPGQGGMHKWTFKVDTPGTAAIELSYGRSWQKSAPARTYMVRIRASA